MVEKQHLSPELTYDLFAQVGFRRYFHFGGLGATLKLIKLLNIKKDHHILEIGCASGKTACHTAKMYNCQVVGIDRSEWMVQRANERARRERVVDKVRFQVASAQKLPFEDESFGIVMGEFITGLVDDKHQAISEYVRVAKTGGYVGFNEATWIKKPPARLAEYLSRTFGVRGKLLSSDGWSELFVQAGLKEIIVQTQKVEAISSIWDGAKDTLMVLPKFVYLYFKSPALRTFIKEAFSVPKNLVEYLGYGIYVGTK